MINPLLEGFDPARRPLLFSRGILACCAFTCCAFWSGSIVQIWLLRNRQFARTLLNRRKQLRQLPSAIAGVLRMEYHDTVSTTPFFGYPRCVDKLRRRSPRQRVSPRSETGRRAVARSASTVNQVR